VLRSSSITKSNRASSTQLDRECW